MMKIELLLLCSFLTTAWAIDNYEYVYYLSLPNGERDPKIIKFVASQNIYDSLRGSRQENNLHPGHPSFQLPTLNFNPENAFAQAGQEYVDLASGNLVIIEPLVHYEGRNNLDLEVLLTYNGGVWRHEGWPRYEGYGSISPITWNWCGLGWDICMGELQISIFRPTSNPQDDEHLPEYSSINLPNEGIKSRVIYGKLVGENLSEYRVENNPDWRIRAKGDSIVAISPLGTKYFFCRWLRINRMWNGSIWKIVTKSMFLTRIEDSNGNYIRILYANPNANGYIGQQFCDEDYWDYSDRFYSAARLLNKIYDTKGDYARFYYHDDYITHINLNWWFPVLDSIRYRVGFNIYYGGPTWNNLKFSYDIGRNLSEASDPFDGKCNLLTKIEYRDADGTWLKPPRQFFYETAFGNLTMSVYPTSKAAGNIIQGGWRKYGYNEVVYWGNVSAGMSYRRVSYMKEQPWTTQTHENMIEYYYGPGENYLPWDDNFINESSIGMDRRKDDNGPYAIGSYRKTKALYTKTGNYDIYYFINDDYFTDFHQRKPIWSTCWKVEHYNSANLLMAKEEYGYDLTIQGQSMIGTSPLPWQYKQLRGELKVKDNKMVFCRYDSYTKFNQWKIKTDHGFIAVIDWGSNFHDPWVAGEYGDEHITNRTYLWEANSNYTSGFVFLIDRIRSEEIAVGSNTMSKIQCDYDNSGYMIYDYYSMYPGYPPYQHITQSTYRGNLTKYSSGLYMGGTWSWVTTHYKYDICGNIVQIINPIGNEITFRYDQCFPSDGQTPHVYQYSLLRKIARYNGSDSICEGAKWFSTQGLISHHFGANSPGSQDQHSWRYRYWMLNQLMSVTAPSDNTNNFPSKYYRYYYYKYGVLNYQYNHMFCLFNPDDNYDPGLNPTYSKQFYIYDYLGKMYQYNRKNPYSVDSTWNINCYYDHNFQGLVDTLSKQFSGLKGDYEGWPSSSPMHEGYTENIFDATGRITRSTLPPGTSEDDRIHYFYNDNIVTITNENDDQRRISYNAYGRISKVEQNLDDNQYTTEYSYDALGNLTQILMNGGAFTITYIYDSMNRLIQKNDPNTGTTKYVYDDAGNPRFSQDANHAVSGDWVYRKYDDLCRLIEEGEIYDVNPGRTEANNQNYPTAGSWRIKKYYDYAYNGSMNPKGNLVRELVSQDGNSCAYMAVFSYDKRNRLICKTTYRSDDLHAGLKIRYAYDAQDNLTKITYPDSEDVIYHLNCLMHCDTVYTGGNNFLASLHYAENERVLTQR